MTEQHDKAQWTVEPWSSDWNWIHADTLDIAVTVIRNNLDRADALPSEANAARIVECVNGFAGVPGPIPPGIVAELLGSLQTLINTVFSHHHCDHCGEDNRLHEGWCIVGQIIALRAGLTVQRAEKETAPTEFKPGDRVVNPKGEIGTVIGKEQPPNQVRLDAGGIVSTYLRGYFQPYCDVCEGSGIISNIDPSSYIEGESCPRGCSVPPTGQGTMTNETRACPDAPRNNYEHEFEPWCGMCGGPLAYEGMCFRCGSDYGSNPDKGPCMACGLTPDEVEA